MPQKLSEMAESLSSHQYRTYIVSMIHKLRTNTDVQLGKAKLKHLGPWCGGRVV